MQLNCEYIFQVKLKYLVVKIKMDNTRRTTRGRPKNVDAVATKTTTKTAIPVAATTVGGRRSVAVSNASTDSSVTTRRASPGRTRSSPSRRASPSRKRNSPVRRSSRPRSTIPTVQSASVAVAPSLKSTKEEEEPEVNLKTCF